MDNSASSDFRSMLSLIWPEPSTILYGDKRRIPNDCDVYLPLPNLARPTLLVPLGTSRLTTASLKKYKSPSNAVGRIKVQGLAVLGRTRAFHLTRARIGVKSPTGASLIEHMSHALGGPTTASIHLGPPRANRKPVLNLMDSEGCTRGFAKVSINGLTNRRLETERQSLALLQAKRLGPLHVPRPISSGTWKGVSYLLLEPLLSWSSEGVRPTTRIRALKRLVSTCEKRVKRLNDSSWWREARNKIATLPTDDGERLRAAAAQLGSRFGHRELHFGAAHGDWTPWNMATSAGSAYVWDWERFNLNIPLGFDAIHYAFNAKVRLHRVQPRIALQQLIPNIECLTNSNDAGDGDGLLVLALYLTDLGERFVSDDQAAAGARRGPLSDWLLPALEEVLAHGSPE